MPKFVATLHAFHDAGALLNDLGLIGNKHGFIFVSTASVLLFLGSSCFCSLAWTISAGGAGHDVIFLAWGIASVEIHLMSASQDQTPEQLKRELPKPYLKPDGTLVIPHNSDPKYHWWRGGQKVEELKAHGISSFHFFRE